MNYADIHGDSVWVTWQTGFWSFIGLGTEHKALYQDKKLYENGTEYKGDNSFALSTLGALNELQAGSEAGEVVGTLQKSEYNYNIEETYGENNFTAEGSKGIIQWNPSKLTGGLDINNSNTRPAFIGLGHELGHGLDVDNRRHGIAGSFNEGNWFTTDRGKNIQLYEKTACIIENKIRAEHNVPLRAYYTSGRFKGAEVLMP